MPEFNQATTSQDTSNLPVSGEPKKRGGLDFRVYQEMKTEIHRDLLNKVDLEKVATVRDERTRRQVFGVIHDLVANLKTPLSGPEKERLSLEVLDEVFGLGPLEPLLQDPTISDILVNGAKEVYVERAGMLEETKIMFKDNAHLMHIIDKIVSAIGRRVDESSPMVDARLADGSRVNVNWPNGGSGNAPQKCGRKYWNPILRLCSPCHAGTKYENRSFTWMFISFHHCGELVGDPMMADGKLSCTQ